MDNSPTALFQSYDADFQNLITSIREKLDGEGKNDRGEARKAVLRRVDLELDEADEMVSQMELEIQGMPTSIKQQYQTRVRTAKSDLTRFKKSAKDQHSALSRSDLLGSRAGGDAYENSDEPYGANSDRQRLLAGSSVLEDGTRRLQDSQRVALETEQQGADILGNLRRQREQIEHARDTLHTADNSIDRASGTLKTMIRRMYQQRTVTIAIIVVLVLIILIILWAKLF